MMRFTAAMTTASVLALAEAERSLPPFSLDTAKAFAFLSEVSYCGPMANLTSWTCDPCTESGISVAPGSVRNVISGEFLEGHANFAFVARLDSGAGPGPLENGCVISVRGSEDFANWIKNIEITVDSMSDVCDGCKAEHGFHSVWHEIDDEIIQDLSELGCGPGEDPIFITGHSLGAAVATVATLELHSKGFDVRAAYFFESPRVGNKAFAEYFDSQFNGQDVWRITHNADPVPSVPDGFGYHHTGQEVFFDKHGDYHLCTSYSDCEQYKPFVRLSGGDHCSTPLVPDGICACRGWVEGVPKPTMVV